MLMKGFPWAAEVASKRTCRAGCGSKMAYLSEVRDYYGCLSVTAELLTRFVAGPGPVCDRITPSPAIKTEVHSMSGHYALFSSAKARSYGEGIDVLYVSEVNMNGQGPRIQLLPRGINLSMPIRFV